MTDTAGTQQSSVPVPPSDAAIASLLDSLDISAESNLIGVLQAIQDRLGYLPPPALADLSRRMRIPLSRIWGVVSFYAQFYTEPQLETVACLGTCFLAPAMMIDNQYFGKLTPQSVQSILRSFRAELA